MVIKVIKYRFGDKNMVFAQPRPLVNDPSGTRGESRGIALIVRVSIK